MLGEAFSNWGNSVANRSKGPPSPPKSPQEGGSHHEYFVHSLLIPLVIQLQKETRGRRYREIQSTLQDAITALVAFQSEAWPAAAGSFKEQTEEQPSNDAEEETIEFSTDTNTETVHDSNNPDDKNDTTANSSLFEDDDPQTREPVHDAIGKTLEAFMGVLGHPATTPKAKELALDGISKLVAKRYVSGRAGASAKTATAKTTTKATPTDADGASDNDNNDSSNNNNAHVSLLHRVLESVSKCSETSVDTTLTAMVHTLRTILISPKCGVHDASMLLALRTVFHVYLITKADSCKEAAKLALLDMLRSVFARMEAHHAVSKAREQLQAEAVALATTKETDQPRKPLEPEETGTTTATASSATSQQPDHSDRSDAGVPFVSQYHADSYTLFRALCKLSSKELPADNIAEKKKTSIFQAGPITDPLALKSKILALELIWASLEYYCGPAACTNERFVYLVQHYLCVSLLKNCVSHHTQVAYLSQKIFLVLISKFKGHLKQEIEVFLSNVFLRVLDSPNSSFQQKALLLESLRSLCGDPVLLTQVFLHYDCDFDAMNLYKDIVHMLTKLGGKATGMTATTTTTKKDIEEEFELSLAGMEVLVTILKAFLKALGLPVTTEEGNNEDDSAGARIRAMLQLDVGLAAAAILPEETESAPSSTDNSVASSELAEQPRLNEGEPAGSSAEVAGRIVDAFEMKRNAEQNFEIGAVKFTLSLKSGLHFFIENGFTTCDAREVAHFFLSHKEKLDKTQMGEALGRETDAAFIKGDNIEPDKGGPGFWVRLLHHYVDAQDFTEMMFDDAIRSFLSGFRLPGEAQKIDRIMEKFAERFTSQNPDVFPSADTAFILAFSVIMLNTDLHNPSIKPERRMTIDSFIRNNRGIGENGGDLPEDFLGGIFERIKERPFSLKEDDAARERVGAQKQIFDTSVFFEGPAFFGTSTDERKRENFKKERDEMMAVTEQLIRRRSTKPGKTASDSSKLTDTIAPSDVVKPMFDVTWGPMIGILSQVLECSDDDRTVAVCLNGFVYAVRVAAHSHMSLARDTFVSSLAKFTFLGSIKEMKRKNVESIRTLLSIAIIDGEHLGESWGPVLQCISQLARLRLTASGLDSDESFLVENEKAKTSITSNRAMDSYFRTANRADQAREAEESNGRAVLEAVQEVLLDKVFSSTVSLSAKSLAHFIEQLISVSSSEIGGPAKKDIPSGEAPGSLSDTAAMNNSRSGKADGPSIFSLQRLVEVADYNMDVRPRLVWAQVWELMADFFAQNACHENAMVSVFAIDSLKQLSFKFLEKPELSGFDFQRLFLKPFLDVMENKSSREDVRELVLRCVDNMIRTKSHNLRSGWKIVFSILKFSASDPSEKIEYLGLAILQRLLDEHLDEVCSLSSDDQLDDEESGDLLVRERKRRTANSDDFVNLCRASLSFVQKDTSSSPRPAGLSLRALVHTAIYADLLSRHRIQPPDSGTQSLDDSQQGYTYEGLSEKESLEMVLWRPLLEGLAEGIKSPARGSVGGIGCLVPRASLLALRAILLRHGRLFSANQLCAVLEQTMLPAIQKAATSDSSPVVHIISESPSVSSVDFLVDPLPLPPREDDPKLLLFEASSSTQDRPMGSAELMLEASFTDLRHGGDGDLRRAYILAKKSGDMDTKPHEQPFPDSWVATSATIAIGILTDLLTEVVPAFPDEQARKIWSLVSGQYKLWFLGNIMDGEHPITMRPCEALVRISCREVGRLAEHLMKPERNNSQLSSIWNTWVMSLFFELMTGSTENQRRAYLHLMKSKEKAMSEKLDSEANEGTGNGVGLRKTTAYGSGRLTERRLDHHEAGHEADGVSSTEVEVIALDFGATLYAPTTRDSLLDDAEDTASPTVSDVPNEADVPIAYFEETVPNLKIRCVSAYCLNQAFMSSLDLLVPLANEDSLERTVQCLNDSRLLAAGAVGDEDVSTAFQEALLSDWGDGAAMPDESGEATARLSLQHGSAVFFLAQESGATKTLVHLLASLYLSKSSDQVDFAEPRLLEVFVDALEKFVDSEAKFGHLVDPNVWRTANERGGKLALHCTFFVPVVVELLKTIRSLSSEQFSRHKQPFFSAVCKLTRTQSEEIRILVQEILVTHVAPLLGVKVFM